MAAQLEGDCARHKLQKVQRQYTGDVAELGAVLRATVAATLTIRYEAVVRCKGTGTVDLFEYLFDGQGRMLSRSKVVFRNSSHLEY
jgi:hypothetical protein